MVKALAGRGVTVVYTTHYMEEAERLCSRIAIIDHGRLAGVGTRDELIRTIGGGERVELALAEGVDRGSPKITEALAGLAPLDPRGDDHDPGVGRGGAAGHPGPLLVARDPARVGHLAQAGPRGRVPRTHRPGFEGLIR